MSQTIVEQQTGIQRNIAQAIAAQYRQQGGHTIEFTERNYFDCDLTVTKRDDNAIQGSYRRVN